MRCTPHPRRHSALHRLFRPRLRPPDPPLVLSQVDLLEESSGRILPCFLAAQLKYNSETFAALYPVDAPVSLAEMVGDRLMPIDPARETPELMELAKGACAESGITLLETPVVLTASSGPELDAIEDEGEPVEFADDEEDDEGEEALILAQFDDQEGASIMVVQTLDPLYVVGKEMAGKGKRYSIPSDEEIDAVSDAIEELVVEFEDQLDAADDDDDDEYDA